MRKRIKFTKSGMLKFIGHLDLLRIFQRALRKANIPMAYSQGFNPHPLISFAQPLGLGFTSEGEYFEVTLTEHMDNQELIRKVNEVFPDGLQFIECIDLQNKDPKAMAIVDAAKYSVKLDKPISQEQLSEFMNQESIIIQKRTKKKRIKEVDLKPGIINIELKDNRLEITCKAGTDNIKPQLVISAMYSFLDYKYDEYAIEFHRIELYTNDKNELKPLIWSD